MSLISEALKKAQAQRQGSPAPSDPTRTYVPLGQPKPPGGLAEPPPQPVTGPAALAAPVPQTHAPKWGVVLGVLVTVACLFVLSAAAIVWAVIGLNRDEPAPADVVATTLPVEAPTSAPAPASTSSPKPGAIPAEPSPSAPATAPEPELAGTAPPETPPPGATSLSPAQPTPAAPETIATSPSRQAPTAPALPEAKPAAAPVTTAPAVASAPRQAVPAALTRPPAPPDPATRAYLASLEVRGVMTGGQKILLFDPSLQRSRAFSPEDLVDAERGLRVTAITENSLEFIDERGAIYTKRF